MGTGPASQERASMQIVGGVQLGDEERLLILPVEEPRNLSWRRAINSQHDSMRRFLVQLLLSIILSGMCQ
jgi:hypothetical protein